MKEEYAWFIVGGILTYLGERLYKHFKHKFQKNKYEKRRNRNREYY